ncbi:hypothetical protein AMTRI_Chr12g233650 [Amborella trichopoda]
MEIVKEELLPPLLESSSSDDSSSLPSSVSDFSEEEEEEEELQRLTQREAPPTVAALACAKKRLTKQLSMFETSREAAWERRRHQFLKQEERSSSFNGFVGRSLTDEDLDELKGCIELGFGFDHDHEDRTLCNTLPALDLYYAVNRQLSDSKMTTTTASTQEESTPSSSGGQSSSFGSPRSPNSSEAWKIFTPGDNPQHVKRRLRHWAQAVACSVRQIC